MPKVTEDSSYKVTTCNTTRYFEINSLSLKQELLVPAGCTREWPWQQPSLPCSPQGYFLCFFFFFLGALLAFLECLGLLLEG